MTVGEVEHVVDLTVDAMPEDVRDALVKVEIHVAESRADIEALREAVTASGQQRVAIPQDFRGVFLGIALSDADDDEDPERDLPEGVILLNAAKMRTADDVVFTLFHEVGHALGLDEDEVDALGLG